MYVVTYFSTLQGELEVELRAINCFGANYLCDYLTLHVPYMYGNVGRKIVRRPKGKLNSVR